MKLLIRTIASVLLVTLLLNGVVLNCHAHDSREHDKEMMAVLFSKTETYVRSQDTDKYIKALKYASYLTVDQFGQDGESKFNDLKSWKMKGLPSKFSDIKYEYVIPRGNSDLKVNANTHRRYTHQGWIIKYGNSEANRFWDTRKKVLLGTVNTIFEFNKAPIVIRYDNKCVDFCGIIYYVHILGDYIEADNYKKLNLLVPLAGSNDGVDMIANLREYIELVFADQKKSVDYTELMKGLEKIEKTAKPIQQSIGGVNTDEEFAEYHKCAEDLLNLLIDHIPALLKNEEFFRNVFYPNITR